MKKIVLLLLILFMPMFSIKGQTQHWSTEKEKEIYDRGASISMILPSFMRFSLSQLNPLLSENGYPLIPQNTFNYGIGVSYRLNRFESGINSMISYQTRSNELLNSETLRKSLGGNLFLQYHLFRKGVYSFYPFIGYSATDVNLIVSKKPLSDDISNLLRNPGTSLNLSHLSEGIIFGFGVDLADHWQEAPGLLRLKMGYRISIRSHEWESKFFQLNNPPIDTFSGFFIQFEIGGLANWKKDDPWMNKYKF